MEKFLIKNIKARQILDCRGWPTVEADVMTENGILGRADVPVGKSRGEAEAYELRDDGERYAGRGVLKAVKNITEKIAPVLKGIDVREQRKIDTTMIELDGTENKSNLGGNAIVGVSLAVSKAAAAASGIPLYRYVGGINANTLPVPLLNYINGGKLAATDLDFQEHMILPVGAKTFSEAMALGTEVYYLLGEMLAKKYSKYVLNTADEGGYTPPMKDPCEAFDIELEAIEELGYGKKFVLGLDVAASHLYNKKKGTYTLMDKEITREKLIDFYIDLCKAYPVKTIEDPLWEEDFEGHAELVRALGIQIVGDDLFVTNKLHTRTKTDIEFKSQRDQDRQRILGLQIWL
jgi:enolase